MEFVKMNIEKLSEVQLDIISEIKKSLELLGADSGLMTCVSSWGDTLPQEDILKMIKDWNDQAVMYDWIKQKTVFN